jgi:hypothetical protein
VFVGGRVRSRLFAHVRIVAPTRSTPHGYPITKFENCVPTEAAPEFLGERLQHRSRTLVPATAKAADNPNDDRGALAAIHAKKQKLAWVYATM